MMVTRPIITLAQVQSGDESEEKESQLYGSTSARDMSSLAGTSITRDSWDTRDTSITRDSWDTRDTKDTRDSWDTNLSSKDTWDPKIRLKDTWQNSKSSRDSWELSTSTRDSLEPRTSVYRNPLQVACSISTDFVHFFDMLTLRILRTILECPEFIFPLIPDLPRSYQERSGPKRLLLKPVNIS